MRTEAGFEKRVPARLQSCAWKSKKSGVRLEPGHRIDSNKLDNNIYTWMVNARQVKARGFRADSIFWLVCPVLGCMKLPGRLRTIMPLLTTRGTFRQEIGHRGDNRCLVRSDSQAVPHGATGPYHFKRGTDLPCWMVQPVTRVRGSFALVSAKKNSLSKGPKPPVSAICVKKTTRSYRLDRSSVAWVRS